MSVFKKLYFYETKHPIFSASHFEHTKSITADLQKSFILKPFLKYKLC